MIDKKLEPLCAALGYHFKDWLHLKQALTHCSAGSPNNERYEFLGDALLNCIMAAILFQQFPEESEGALSRLRAFLVREESLASLAKQFNLGQYLYLGAGEIKNGGAERASTLADALEALIAAVYLDAGFSQTQTLILTLYEKQLAQSDLIQQIDDPKTGLQEWLQGRKLPLPEYRLIDSKGAAHRKIFYVACKISLLNTPCFGEGSTRRKAEQAAAAAVLAQLQTLDFKKIPKKN